MTGAGGQDPSEAPVVRPARPQDVPVILELIAELAAYERMQDTMQATAALLGDALFGERPAAEALIAERGSQPVGYALFFPTFSSFLATRGVWLEDLFVRPAHRRSGAGKALLAAVAARACADGGQRLEWAALDWNELALGFYQSVGARTMNEWVTHRLHGEALRQLADHACGDPGPV